MQFICIYIKAAAGFIKTKARAKYSLGVNSRNKRSEITWNNIKKKAS